MNPKFEVNQERPSSNRHGRIPAPLSDFEVSILATREAGNCVVTPQMDKAKDIQLRTRLKKANPDVLVHISNKEGKSYIWVSAKIDAHVGENHVEGSDSNLGS